MAWRCLLRELMSWGRNCACAKDLRWRTALTKILLGSTPTHQGRLCGTTRRLSDRALRQHNRSCRTNGIRCVHSIASSFDGAELLPQQMTLQEARILTLRVLKQVMEEKLDHHNVQLAQVRLPPIHRCQRTSVDNALGHAREGVRDPERGAAKRDHRHYVDSRTSIPRCRCTYTFALIVSCWVQSGTKPRLADCVNPSFGI